MSSTTSTKKRVAPPELGWVKHNFDQFDHILFFNYFSSYHQRRAVRRFKTIVEFWINDESKKATLLNNYNKWSKSKEAKLYWKQRQEVKTSSEESSASFSETSTSTSITTSFILITTKNNKEKRKKLLINTTRTLNPKW
ncbi:uncharacterized protein BX663DRAFT_501177 [Cokeromyces recurvatus]|uniref:uncharacterized protein n=1 Tax=Cokeromyces recurvatus TaxID=90255 RepID=UPI00222088F7|nr:uncharacterized protein BX663DRAFT_501177 [Cokeromyces recurvatus]KAI7904961.1 hypothetical protein BX663DRAFT_501177 [Cokeromyces recurvatus]